MELYYIDVLLGLLAIGMLDYFFVYRRKRTKVANGDKKHLREMAHSYLEAPLSYNYDGGVLFIPLPVSIVAFLSWQDLGYENGEHVFALVFLATILIIVAIGRRVTSIASSWMLYSSATFVLLSFGVITNMLSLLFIASAIAVGSFSLSYVLHRNDLTSMS